MLQLKNIHKTYAVGDSEVTALQDITLSFRNHEFVSILGPSGCGKTTMLNIIGGLDRYTSGDLVINGRSTKEYKDADWDIYRNHSIGFVFQSYNLIPHQNVLSNVELALTLSGVSKNERRKRAVEVLEKVGLGDQLYKKPSQMSGGQMQRVAIARALVNEPDILLADEPTGALDTATSVQIMELLKEISSDKLVIMVTHNPELAEKYSTRIVKLRDGVIQDDTSPFDGTLEKPLGTVEKSGIDSNGRKERKPSMSFFTALSLSAHNLMTKKGRTFMTAFAGSIGIIGIALILALSTGIQTYIDDVQRDTLSSYPVMIEKEQTDMASLMEAFAGAHADEEKDHEKDAVYSSSQMYDLFNAMFHAEKTTNNLKEFKVWLDNQMEQDTSTTQLYDHVATVQYQYNMPMNIYVTNSDGDYVSTDLATGFTSAGVSESTESNPLYGMASSSLTNVSLWQEILPGQNGALISDVIYDQYDLVYGHWPESADEVVLILDKNNEVSDMGFYAMGQIPANEISNTITSAMNQEEIIFTSRRLDYEEICAIPFKLLLNTDLYVKSEDTGMWESIGEDSARMDLLINNGYDLHVSAIIRPKEDATSTALTGPFAYTSALTAYMIETTRESEIAQEQLLPKNENYDVLTGLPFVITSEIDPTDSYKAEEIKHYLESLNEKEKSELYERMISEPSKEYVEETLKTYMAQYETREEMQKLISDAYGMAMETIETYLEDYTDEELQELLREQFTSMIQEQYAAAAAEQVETIRNTPSEGELATIAASITSQLSDIQMKIGYVTADWMENTSMSQDAITGYLMGLPAQYLEQAVQDVALKQAEKEYAVYAGMNEDAADAKVAAVFDEQILSVTDEATLADWYDHYMPSTISGSTYEETLEKLGILDLAVPDSIYLYAKTFEDKDFIADAVSVYNEEQMDEDQKIKYTDYVALLMSGVTGIINAISYVLIAFVAISLVVSSIMIGIITYISVLERTKEIGILRSIGASKKDISRVFNAETLIVGFTAGALGILVSSLICIPANLLIEHFTQVSGIHVHLPVLACVILIAISMLLTWIAGLMPAGVAARKDPVEALRSE